jgi:Histidinol dehydrogenase
MLVSNDTNARVAIDMPAGPSEVLVIADKTANPAFVAADLLSQAEHGPDSQVVLIAVDLNDTQLLAIEQELHSQAHALPRVDIVRGAINHSVTLCVRDVEEALRFSNQYAPEHLILQIQDPEAAVKLVENAGSVFIGMWTPESVGDYSAGVNHSLRKFERVSWDPANGCSHVWIRQAIFGGQPGIIHQAYYELPADPRGIEKCRRCGGTTRGSGGPRRACSGGVDSAGGDGTRVGIAGSISTGEGSGRGKAQPWTCVEMYLYRTRCRSHRYLLSFLESPEDSGFH